ncbi:MAG: type 2 isopentenyl-diphosphate Delta-isomerase [Actinomycetota bacterium]|nr:type 2 isopentenyl-diphosphate Delta-isomerase [Actinomycetota bacterium]
MKNNSDKNIHSARKEEHLSISLNHDIDYIEKSTGFEKYYFIHNALPEISLEEIDTSITVLGKKLSIPLMISPMVGGIDEAAKINKDLAMVAKECKIGMGTGSQRIAIEDKQLSKTFSVRDIAPEILLFANLGAVQLNYGYDIKHCRKAIEMIDADALFLHLNPLQEALQVEGNYNFRDLLSKISLVCSAIEKPVLVREVGFGISAEAALKLKLAGVFGIDTGGSGGTSWIEIEKTRLSLSALKKAAQFFGSWGIPTADSIKMVRESCPDIFLIASGGIRTGIDVAKAIALGADIAGIALPVLKQVKISIKEAISFIREIEAGLKIAMFCIGAQNIKQLKHNFNLRHVEK